jgi:hypothetical protein
LAGDICCDVLRRIMSEALTLLHHYVSRQVFTALGE